MKTLSISKPYSADNICSTVDMVLPYASPKVVQSWVDLTFSNEALILKTLFPFFILKT